MNAGEAFEILGLEPTEDLEVVHIAFRAAIRECHPDRWPDRGEEAKAVTRARDVAVDAIKRGFVSTAPADDPASDDPWRHARSAAAEGPPPQPPPPPPPPAPAPAPAPSAVAADDKLERSRRRTVRWLWAAAVMSGLLLIAQAGGGGTAVRSARHPAFEAALGSVRNDTVVTLAAFLVVVQIGGALRWWAFRRRLRRAGRALPGRPRPGRPVAFLAAAAASFTLIVAGWAVYSTAQERFEADSRCVSGDDCPLVARTRADTSTAYRLMAASALLMVGASSIGIRLCRSRPSAPCS
jgi:hypothetical protein